MFPDGVFWAVTPCSVAVVYQHFRGPCCLHVDSEPAWTSESLVPTATTSQPRRPCYNYFFREGHHTPPPTKNAVMSDYERTYASRIVMTVGNGVNALLYWTERRMDLPWSELRPPCDVPWVVTRRDCSSYEVQSIIRHRNSGISRITVIFYNLGRSESENVQQLPMKQIIRSSAG
jgi:hypothetical protein